MFKRKYQQKTIVQLLYLHEVSVEIEVLLPEGEGYSLGEVGETFEGEEITDLPDLFDSLNDSRSIR